MIRLLSCQGQAVLPLSSWTLIAMVSESIALLDVSVCVSHLVLRALSLPLKFVDGQYDYQCLPAATSTDALAYLLYTRAWATTIPGHVGLHLLP